MPLLRRVGLLWVLYRIRYEDFYRFGSSIARHIWSFDCDA